MDYLNKINRLLNRLIIISLLSLIILCILVFNFRIILLAAKPIPQPKPITNTDLNKTIAPLEEQLQEIKIQLQEIKNQQNTTQSPPWLKEQSNSRKFHRLIMVNRGGNMINRLNAYLTNSPLAGQGRTIYLAAIDNNIDPRMMVAIATVESSKGRYLAGRHNAWGRKAVNGGWESWPNWEVAINNQAQYMARWGSKIWKVYCVPPEPWGSKVRSEMAKV